MNILKSDCCNSLVVNEYDANTRSYFEDNICFNCKQIGVKTDENAYIFAGTPKSDLHCVSITLRAEQLHTVNLYSASRATCWHPKP